MKAGHVDARARVVWGRVALTWGLTFFTRVTVIFLPDKLQNEIIQKVRINVLYDHFGVRLSPSNLIAAPRDLP